MATIIKTTDSKIGAGVQFNATTTVANSFTLDPGAFLVSTDASAIILLGTGAGAWTATINGQAVGNAVVGVGLAIGTTAPSKLTIGADASLFGNLGFQGVGPLTMTNAGDISGSTVGILQVSGALTVTNSGTISGGSYALTSFAANNSFTNGLSGVVYGNVFLGGSGVNKLVNSGTISLDTSRGIFTSDVLFGGGNDSLDNKAKATIEGMVFLGDGTNSVINAGRIFGSTSVNNGILSINGGSQTDTITNAKTGVFSGAVLAGDGINIFNNSGYVGDHTSDGTGVSYFGGEEGTDTVVNAAGATLAGVVNLAGGLNTLTNAGTIGTFETENSLASTLSGGSATDKITNSGTIRGSVALFDDNDIFTNTGKVTGTINLGAGNDTFKGGNTTEVVIDSEGKDSYSLGGGDDVFFTFGGEGSDLPDTVDGGTGVDTYADSTGLGLKINLDTISHTSVAILTASVVLAATTSTNTTNLSIETVKNFENVVGGGSNDLIFGSSVRNIISGGGGSDQIWGFAGNDLIAGNSGSDFLVGGAGKDELRGGTDGDSFVFTAITDSGLTPLTRDVILDFEDTIDLINLAFIDADTRASAVGNSQFTNVITGDGGFTVGQAATLRVYQTATGFRIEGETNGDGKADFSIAVNDLDHSTVWSADDFIL
jgi:Ca2+-binding RTX toxin-like protein